MARPNGFRVTDLGQLRVTTTEPIAYWNGGLPFGEDGDLVCQVAAPTAADPFVGGIRVNAAGVFVYSPPPPPP